MTIEKRFSIKKELEIILFHKSENNFMGKALCAVLLEKPQIK